ncbi:MAG: hypothetical protein QOF60_3471 [Actinomycetota bacterium]|jgi:hypothetical protein|nr:hypothetical protein [Actinomycetota bacterium]
MTKPVSVVAAAKEPGRSVVGVYSHRDRVVRLADSVSLLEFIECTLVQSVKFNVGGILDRVLVSKQAGETLRRPLHPDQNPAQTAYRVAVRSLECGLAADWIKSPHEVVCCVMPSKSASVPAAGGGILGEHRRPRCPADARQ